MKLFSVATVLAAVVSTANALVVNTPTNVVQCQPLLITWDPQGSAGPFFLSIHPGDNPSAAALFSWDNLTGTSFTWIVSVAAGQSLGLLLRDTTGASSQSAPFPVFAGSTTVCPASSSSVSSVSGSSSLPSGSSSSSVSSSSSLTTTSTSTSTKPSTSTSSSVRPSSSTTSTSPTTSPTSNATGGSGGGALSNAVDFGFAGFFAALVGAVLA